MKKILSLLFLSLTLVFAGCSDDDADGGALTIVSSDVDFQAPGGTGTIVFSGAGNVTASSDSEAWLTISSTTGNIVSYAVAENTGIISRTGTVTITNGSRSQSVAVTQMGTILDIQDEYVIDAVSTTYYFDLYTNSESVSVSAADSWVTSVSVENGELVVVPEMNVTGAARSTTLTFTCGWKTVTATLTQNSFVSITSISFTQPGGTYQFMIDESIDLIADTWTVTPADTWFTVATNGYTVTVTAVANGTGAYRTSSITITAGSVTMTISVKQSSITDYYSYFLGAWTLWYHDDNNALTSTQVNIVQNVAGSSYTMKGLDYDITLTYNSTNHTISMVMQYVGRYANYYYIYLCPMSDASGGYFTWATGTGFTMTFNGDEVSPALTFSDNGTWGTYKSDGIIFWAFTSSTPSSSSSAGNLSYYSYIVNLTR